jgi:carboxylate-amine ligase
MARTSPLSEDPWALAHAPGWELPAPLDAESLREIFDAARPLTLGVEEELMLLYPDTFALAPEVEHVLERVADPRVNRELRAAQLELVTPVCTSVAQACSELTAARALVVDHLDGRRRIAAAGTHPFSTDWGEIAGGERYRMLADEYVWAARRTLACGLHVHVAVGGAERTLGVYNALRSFLPELAALGANSPFFEGRDSGLCSVRPKLNEAFPRAGTPPAFTSWEDFVELLDWGRRGGLFPDASHFWWDLRIQPRFGTLEVRVADAQTHVAATGALVALVQCLVAWLSERFDAGDPLPVHEAFRIHENAWRALRYGVRGWLVDLETGEPEPARDRVERLLTALEPTAGRLGSVEQLLEARTLLAGNGADRQRYVEAREGIVGLVRWLAHETETL